MKKKLFFVLALFFILHNVQASQIDMISEKSINYVPDELKFYNNSRVLNAEEVQEFFPEYKIILISKFDKNRKYKIKNSLFKSQKVLLLNDTKRTFHGFEIYPLSSREQKDSKSLITVYGKKNVRLKHFGGDEFEIVVK